MSFPNAETHEEYARRTGAPRVVPCDIDLGPNYGYVWICRAHDYRFHDLPKALDGWPHRSIDRCPMARLEEWRAKRWALVG